jgi:hypothetical protein
MPGNRIMAGSGFYPHYENHGTGEMGYALYIMGENTVFCAILIRNRHGTFPVILEVDGRPF